MKSLFTFLIMTVLISMKSYGQFQYVDTYAGSQSAGNVNGSLTSSKFNYPYGVTFDGNQALYVADLFNHSIRKIDMSTGTVSTLAGTGSSGFVNGTGTSASFNSPSGVFYKNGFVYVSDNLNNAIRKIDVLTGAVTTVAGSGVAGLQNGAALSATFYQPKSLVVDDSGDVYVADYENHVVRKISAGVVSTFAGTGASGFADGPVSTAQFWRPRDLTFDAFGNLYVTDLMNNRVRKISNGVVSTLAGSGSAGTANGTGTAATFNIPTGIEFFNGFLYVTDGIGNKIRKVSLTGIVTTVAGSGSTGYVNGATGSAQFDLMQDLTLDNNGNIYIGDRNNNCIRIVATTSNLLEGYVYDDVNSNCIKEAGDISHPNWILKAVPGPFYSGTDANGYYNLPVPTGTYTVTQIIQTPHLWDTVCPGPAYTHSATVTTGTTISNLDFAIHANMYCPILTVDVGAASVRRCMNNAYYVQYCNIGNDTANNVFIKITLDSLLSISSSLIPWDSLVGNTYTFNVGTLTPFQCGNFWFNAYLDCAGQLGSTRCVKALIGPYYSCSQPIDSTWDHSSVMVEGECTDSLACFTITNTGDLGSGDMLASSDYRIYENGVLVYSGTFQLLGASDTSICWPANGNTIQLQADQRPGHPGNSHPNEYVEDCGTPGGSSPVFGIATATAPDDQNYDVEIECIQVTGSFDPNDKTVIPAGLGPDHYIQEDDELEYKVRFQNTGNDTAFTVVIRDTLSGLLDPTTVVSGVSSHNYSFELFGNGILQWTFVNILLPDSNVNEPASHGFVKFKIKQMPGNPIGSVIENRVGIIFDFNDPVITNTAFSTVWQELVLSIQQNNYSRVVKTYPNPSSGLVNFEMETSINEQWNLIITDATGRVLQNKVISGKSKTSADMSGYSKGVYFFRIGNTDGLISSGKILVQ
jgi:uncharacterized repeat protein (TIGR01451 family)